MQRHAGGGDRVCSENREMSSVAGAKRGHHVPGELERPAETQSCWAWNPLASGSSEKPLEGSENGSFDSTVPWYQTVACL